jgi:ankyrin repeat protein
LDALEHCLDYRSLQQALASLPKTLDETYARILFSIPDEHKQNAIRILQFLTYSERPLRIDEAVDLITVDTGEAKYFNEKYRMPDPSEISRYCSSLVVLVSARDNWVDDEEDWDDEEEDWDNEEDNTVRLQLAHFSVKEYLTSTRLDKDIAQNFHETAARGSMATVCLAYLLHIDMDLLAKGIRQRFPLAQYSARYWMSNAAVAEGQDHKLGGFISQFFCCHKSSYNNCYSLYRPDQPPGHRPDTSGKPASALYYASFGGLVNAVELLLSKGADVNAQGGYCYGNALQAASVNGHTAIVELLLRKGADVNAQEGYHGNAQEGYHGNALQAASIYGYTETVELLLSKGADVNIEGGYYYGNALQAASFNGYTAIVELLLSKGADVNAQGGYFYGNALQAASTKGHTTTVELLLSKGADVNARGGHYGNALQAASAEGHTAIVELLLSTGADVNAQGGHYGNALQAASSRGHTATVELLLNRVPKDSI